MCAIHAAFRRPMARHAFTLVELLTIIAIIAILAGILMPALVSAIGTARQTYCMSNMRQMGIAINAYAEDHNSYFPGNIYNTDDRSWQAMLEKNGYIPTLYRRNASNSAWVPTGDLYCPELHQRFIEWVRSGGRPLYQFISDGEACTTTKDYYSYAMPFNASDSYNPNNTYLAIGGRQVKASKGLPAVPNVRIAYVISSPSQTLLLMEWINQFSASVNQYSMSSREIGTSNWFNQYENYMIHGGLYANLLRVDGHIDKGDAFTIQQANVDYRASGKDTYFHYQLGH